MNMRSIIPAIVFALFLLPLTVSAQSQPPFSGYAPTATCLPGVVSFCGVAVQVPGGQVGSAFQLHLPARFVNPLFTVICRQTGAGANYMIDAASSSNACQLRECDTTQIKVCDTLIRIPYRMVIGDTRKVQVPPDALASMHRTMPLEVNVMCDLSDKGLPEARVTDRASFSCNDFSCPPTTLTHCNKKIDIKRAADLGETFTAETEGHEPVTVQCVGSGGERPNYQITDSSQIWCIP